MPQVAKTIMVQGTASSVGKSITVSALCRIFRQDGHRVAPFKAQNMSLNSFVTKNGCEIGRAQAVQAEAAGIEPTANMNPVLLKPESDCRSQVIVMGKVWKTLDARQYWKDNSELLGTVSTALNQLRHEYDIVVIEGAGSPAEINLRDREIVNMRVAFLAGAPVLLVGDIDRGGVFASLVGTMELLTPAERNQVKGLIINKFRGDNSLLRPGIDLLEEKTKKPCLGVIPYIKELGIAQEDSVYLDERRPRASIANGIDIAVVWLPHMSNYDDFDPLERKGCNVRYVSSARQLGQPDLVILPGTKSSVSDLEHIRECGVAAAVVELARRGVPVIGICGGYQMLGNSIIDSRHVESDRDAVDGLGLLDVCTVFEPEKRTVQIKARVEADLGLMAGLRDQEVVGYEIHMGRTEVRKGRAAFAVYSSEENSDAYPEGCVNETGSVVGTYLHGIFNNEGFTSGLLGGLSKQRGAVESRDTLSWRQAEYDRLAGVVRLNLDMKAVYKILEGGVEAQLM